MNYLSEKLPEILYISGLLFALTYAVTAIIQLDPFTVSFRPLMEADKIILMFVVILMNVAIFKGLCHCGKRIVQSANKSIRKVRFSPSYRR